MQSYNPHKLFGRVGISDKASKKNTKRTRFNSVGAMAMAVASSSFVTSSTSIHSNRFSAPKIPKIERGRLCVVCRKKDIHPKYYHKARVYCEGDLALVTGGTKPIYEVDVWAGNHPFYLSEKDDVDPFAARAARKAKGKKSQDSAFRDLNTEVRIGSKIKHIKLR